MENQEPPQPANMAKAEPGVEDVLRRKKTSLTVVTIVLAGLLVVSLAIIRELVRTRRPKEVVSTKKADRYILKLSDGTIVRTYSDTGLISLQLLLGDKVVLARTTPQDIEGLRPLDKVLYVYGSEKIATVSPSAYAFEKRASAEEFLAEHGGEIIDHKELLKRRRADMERISVRILAPALTKQHSKKTVDMFREKLRPYEDKLNIAVVNHHPDIRHTLVVLHGHPVFLIEVGGQSTGRLGDKELDFGGWPLDSACPCGSDPGNWMSDDLVKFIAQECSAQ